MKKIISLCLILIISIVCASNVMAMENGLKVEVYIADSFIWKNGVSSFESNLRKSFGTAAGVFDASSDINLAYTFLRSDTFIIPTYAAECPNLQYSNFFSFCSCASDWQYVNNIKEHHTSVDVISNEIPTPNKTKKSTMLLTGSHLCYSNNGNHGYVNGISYYTVCKALVSQSENSNGTSLLTMDIIHELGHFYLVKDHYGTSATGNPKCIWGNYRHDDIVLNSNSICQACLNTLRTNNDMFRQG